MYKCKSKWSNLNSYLLDLPFRRESEMTLTFFCFYLRGLLTSEAQEWTVLFHWAQWFHIENFYTSNFGSSKVKSLPSLLLFLPADFTPFCSLWAIPPMQFERWTSTSSAGSSANLHSSIARPGKGFCSRNRSGPITEREIRPEGRWSPT